MLEIKLSKLEKTKNIYDTAQPLLSVYNAGSLLSQFYLQDIDMEAIQYHLGLLDDIFFLETHGECTTHRRGICHDVIYDDQEFKYYLVVGLNRYPIREDRIATVLFAKFMADSMVIPKSVNAVSGIDFSISEEGEVYIAWPILEPYY